MRFFRAALPRNLDIISRAPVSGCSLVSLLLEEYTKVGVSWDSTSGTVSVFWAAWFDIGYSSCVSLRVLRIFPHISDVSVDLVRLRSTGNLIFSRILDIISTCPSDRAVTCSVSVSPEECRKI